MHTIWKNNNNRITHQSTHEKTYTNVIYSKDRGGHIGTLIFNSTVKGSFLTLGMISKKEVNDRLFLITITVSTHYFNTATTHLSAYNIQLKPCQQCLADYLGSNGPAISSTYGVGSQASGVQAGSSTRHCCLLMRDLRRFVIFSCCFSIEYSSLSRLIR